MTSKTLRNSLTVVAAIAFATCLTTPGFAKDGKVKTGTFQIVVPKSERGSAGSTPLSTHFVIPKSDRGGAGPVTAQFVPPKADRGNSGSPTTIQFVPPKANRDNSGDGAHTAEFVAPKAPKGDKPVLASAEQPVQPLLLAPASESPKLAVEQGAPAPSGPAVVAETTPVVHSGATVLPANSSDVALAYYRAAEQYGYGDDQSYQSGDDQEYGSDDDNSYEGNSYGGQSYGGENCE
jgi:hypothetical protein